MWKYLKKKFINNYKETDNPEVRLKYGIVAGILGIITNFILFVLKITIGILAASITIIADAINNLSDIGSSAITVLGFKMSGRPADPEHPYGHARYEHIAALIIAIIVMFIGVTLAKESVGKIINPTPVTVDVFTYAVLVFAILFKFAQMLMYKNFAKAINSEALRASAIDSRNDIISTSAVLVAIVLIALFPRTGLSIDGVAGLLVSLFIVITSIKLVSDTITPLLGAKPDKEMVKKIKDKLRSYNGVLGIHDLMIHSYGTGTVFVIVHIEVCNKEDVMVSHDLMDNIERDFRDELGINLCIHMDPIETDNPVVDALKSEVENALYTIDSRLKIHDFRIVSGKSHTNILFDVNVPYGLDVDVKDIESVCRKNVKLKNKSYYIITVDIEYDV
ncbi:MAG: cation transporter [Clostridia bacterium]|nr:cation transporter [Clostridia bacterium]